MKSQRIVPSVLSSITALVVLMSALPAPVFAAGAEPQAGASHHAMADRSQPSELVKAVREATERFRDPAAAEAEGYGPLFGCVTGPDAGAMGLHFVNGAFVGDDVLDVTRPEIVIYEPTADGRLKLIGADFLVFADVWHKTHAETPQIMGQLMHYFESPNRFGLPPFYTLHVWAWKDNPNGMFVNWHPKVSCDAPTR